MIRDILSTYEALQTVWTKIRAELISHTILFVIFVKLIGINLPRIIIPVINPQDILSNPYYQLIKETGILFLFPLLVLLALALYLILFRTVSRFFSTILIALLPLPQITPLNSKVISPRDLLVFALISDSNEDELSQSDINLAFSKFLTKYRVERKAEFDAYIQGVSTYNDNFVAYLGHYVFFLFAWLVIYNISLSGNSWLTISGEAFWKGFFWLSLATIWAWIRMKNLLEVSTNSTFNAVILFAQTDKELAEKLESVSRENDEKRRKILAQLKKLKSEATAEKPSLYRYLRYRFSDRKSKAETRLEKRAKLHTTPVRRKYLTTNSFYDRGQAFGTEKDLSSNLDDEEWIINYVAYVYYNLLEFLKRRALTFIFLLKLWLFGKP